MYVSPEIVAATASLGASFMMLWLFTNRHEFIEGVDRAVIRRQASRSFILGLCALVVYLVTNFAIFEGFYWVVLRWAMGNPLRLIGDIILLVSYSGFFVLMTRAFVLLGMIEYYGSD